MVLPSALRTYCLGAEAVADVSSVVTLVPDGLSVILDEGIQMLLVRCGYSVEMYMAVMYRVRFRWCMCSGAI